MIEQAPYRPRGNPGTAYRNFPVEPEEDMISSGTQGIVNTMGQPTHKKNNTRGSYSSFDDDDSPDNIRDKRIMTALGLMSILVLSYFMINGQSA